MHAAKIVLSSYPLQQPGHYGAWWLVEHLNIHEPYRLFSSTVGSMFAIQSSLTIRDL
jgi:hypothetical protein